MQFIDTHCHIHEAVKPSTRNDATNRLWAKAVDADPDAMIARAAADGVTKMICVGTTLQDSERAVAFAANRPTCRASIGIHPHEAKDYDGDDVKLRQFAALAPRPGVTAVGECGLDYYYAHSPKKAQIAVLRFQIELALEYKKPLIFHVREAFDDFWPVFDSYRGIQGVIHSFSATRVELDQILSRGLYVGLNGIMTFTKQAEQLEAARAVPRDRLLLETDAPFLTPAPFRGSICEPRHVRVTAEFLAQLRGETLEDIASYSTKNAQRLFDWQG